MSELSIKNPDSLGAVNFPLFEYRIEAEPNARPAPIGSLQIRNAADSRRFRFHFAPVRCVESSNQTGHRTLVCATRGFSRRTLGEVPARAPDPNTLLPHATDANPGIADADEMAKPWSSKEFLIRNRFSGENVPGLLIRLPVGSPSQAGGYWAFEQKSPYGNCKLEFLTDLAKLKTDYGFSAARHPMVGNPCSRTVFDPLKTTNLPGSGAWVRGNIVQGSDLRPPLGIELKVEGKRILAIRTE